MTDQSSASPAAMSRIQVRLGDLGLAKENLRYQEPADEGVPQLAETLLAAGVVIPPIVRPGRKGEALFMALDGRRRRFGLILLRERGDIDDDYLVDCLLAETPAQQAAAIVLPNTEHAPVHIADVITAIGKLRRAKMDTRAISNKMGRRWIMIEQGEHAVTHIIPRLKSIVDGGDPSGVSKSVNWQGGGGFRYYRLAPSLLEKDAWGNWVFSKEYDAAKVTQAVCKLMGFVYQPDETRYWMQGRSSETDFIYVTTQSLTHEQLVAISEEVSSECTLLVCCKAFHANVDAFPNLTVRKIPQAVLRKCEWGKDDYSLNVANLPEAPREPDDSGGAPKPSRENGGTATPQDDLFIGEDSK